MNLHENGKICPMCNKDIGILSIMFAGLPNRIKCKNCKAPVKYKNIFWFTIIIFVIALILSGILVWKVIKELDNKSALELLSYLIPFLIIWYLIELFIALYLRLFKILESNQKSNVYQLKKHN